MREITAISNICLFFYSLILFTGCNQSFQPIGDDENYTFSIYGYIDASADTQWVRVAPARQQLETLDEVPEMHVTLTHLESGEMAVMNNSLVPSPDGRHIPLAWTTIDVDPDQSYTLRAERPDGAESHVTVTTPPDFPTPILLTGEQGLSGDLLIKGVERLADVQTIWKSYGRVHYRIRRDWTDPLPGYDYTISLPLGRDLFYLFESKGRQPPPINVLIDVPRQVFIASGGPGWNDEITEFNDLEYSYPKSFSNVEGGVGYVIGIVSKTIPFKGCFNDEGENIACPLEQPF